MPSQPLRLAAGAIVLAALTLASCSSTSDANDSAAADTPASSAVAAPTEDTAQTEAAPLVEAGGQCPTDAPGTKAIVVQGSMDCGTLNTVWARAVADPTFPNHGNRNTSHGNRNTIVVDDWTCRAHAVAPVPTGFCEDAGYQNKFKIVRSG